MASGTDGPGKGTAPGNDADEYIFMKTLSGNDQVSKNDNAADALRPRSPIPSNRHLSFQDLMADQGHQPAESASDMRRQSATATVDRGGPTGSYNPSLHVESSLNEEMEKVFEEPYTLKMDFTNLGVASDAQSYPDQKYSEGDYSSHRRSQVQMYQPMKTHLSSHELKTIKSAHTMFAEESTKRRRHRSSSSSGSGSSKPVKKEPKDANTDKRRRKKGKKKKNKRKLLTATMRSRTMSIPEEDEDLEESDDESEEDVDDEDDNEEQEEEDFDESERKDEDDGAGGHSGLKRMEGSNGEVEKHESDTKSPQKSIMKQAGAGSGPEDQLLVDGNASDVLPAVSFIVGCDTPEKTLDHQDGAGEASQTKADSFASAPNLGRSASECSTCTSVSDTDVNIPKDIDEATAKKSKKPRKKHSHNRHHKRRRKHDDANERRLAGHQLKSIQDSKGPKMTIGSDDEGEGLGGADKNEIQSHRLENRTGIRKHLLHRPVKKRKIRTEMQTKHDHKPHEVFVELDELVCGEWKETARWIKFEEDVEESQMWGKPRVASLSFHSLIELRRMIEKGAVMLDINKSSLSEVANAVVETMIQTGQIRAEDQGNILKLLLSKHNPPGPAGSGFWDKRHLAPQTSLAYNLSQTSFGSFFNPSYASRLNAASNASGVDGTQPLMSDPDVEKGHHRSDSQAGNLTGAPSAKELRIMKKIPEGAEATAVLVGAVDYLEQPTMAFVRLAQGTDLENVVSLPIPVRFIFVLLGPQKADFDYHEIGRSISTLMADQEFHVMAYGALNRVDLLRAINEFLDDSIVLPPGQLENPDLLRNITMYQKGLAKRRERKESKKMEEKPPLPPKDDPLKRTGRLFGGFVRDVKRRYPKYWSDIKDGINLQCLASIIFIYFAALSPAITFGGLLGEKTKGYMGVSEMIMGCCIGGCLFGLLSGQPLLIVGSTGPLLVFEEAVFNFCESNHLPLLAVRVWIGVWIFLICVVTAACEGSFLVRYLTRFTQEIFSALISIIFIYETFAKLAKIFQKHPLLDKYYNETAILMENNCSVYNVSFASNVTTGNETTVSTDVEVHPNTALLSTLLMLGTFIIAYFLRQFKNSKFFRSSVRRTIGDFGVPIAIFTMLLIDYSIKDTYTEKLKVPRGLSPTNPSLRGWIVNPLGEPDQPLPVWMIFGAVLPALLVFILIFMESHITETIVSAPERNLKKGTGYHLNIAVLGLLNVGLSAFGMPWVCCAAVRSITHTNSLTVMSTNQAPGEKARIVGVREQRVTVFIVNACLGLSILMQPLLKEIPLAVLFGIFLYMGVTSLTGVQFIDRIEMLFMPSKNYPDYSYVKVVRPYRIHIFTLIEVVCLAVLWAVKSTPASIAFPFFLVLTVPIRRYLLPRLFTSKELVVLDGSEVKTSVTSQDKDEYNDANLGD